MTIEVISDFDWDELLGGIEQGDVVPFIGRDLLTVRHKGSEVLLYPLLAQRLAQELGVSADNLPVGGELNTVACRFLDKNSPRLQQKIYSKLNLVMPGDDELEVPEPLLQLAEIPRFTLFVSTTFDSLLKRAIDQVRFNGEVKTRNLAFALNERGDLPVPEDLTETERQLPCIFHLFGRLSGRPEEYVVTQEDTVEFIHALQSDTRRPSHLLDKLRKSSLLILGSSFRGWLARFFLRAARYERLSEHLQPIDYVADTSISNDANLVTFLEQFSSAQEIYRVGGAVKFVAELHRRWHEAHPTPKAPPGPTARGQPALETEFGTKAGVVYLSYADADQDAVRKIRKSLEAAEVGVYDRADLRVGEDRQTRLKHNVEGCSLFVPIISRNVLRRPGIGHVFYREWRWAEETRESRLPDSAFFIPVVIDETPPETPEVPEAFTRIHWETALGGEVSESFVNEVQRHYRAYQATLAPSMTTGESP